MLSAAESSLAERIASLPKVEQDAFVRSLTADEAALLEYNWAGFWARPKQLPPPGDWRFWLILAGRGFGKTRCGAEWVIDQVTNQGARRVALVASTAGDARDVMVEGESGILACSPPWFRPVWKPSNRRLEWPNGAIATTFTAEEPELLRGPQHEIAWADELAKWRYAEAWDQLLFGLRLGTNPRAVITTTPKPTPLIKELAADPLCAVTRGSTFENKGNLAPQFLDALLKKYAGTRLGRQELEAEILDDAPGALWKRVEMIDELRASAAPELQRIVVAIDPSVSADSANAETGIVVAGRGRDGHAYVLADGSLEQPTPAQWGTQALGLYTSHKADRIVGEVNNGGDLVEANVKAAARGDGSRPPIPYSFKKVHASRGKAIRAEPVAALYEQKLVHHVGFLPKLEDQMCQWEPGVSTWSPNRVDALVWALTEIMGSPEPKQRELTIGGQVSARR